MLQPSIGTRAGGPETYNCRQLCALMGSVPTAPAAAATISKTAAVAFEEGVIEKMNMLGLFFLGYSCDRTRSNAKKLGIRDRQ